MSSPVTPCTSSSACAAPVSQPADLEAHLLASVAPGLVIASTSTWAAAHGLDVSVVEGTARSLEADGYVLGMLKPCVREDWALTAEGSRYAAEGSPEARLVTALAAAAAAGAAPPDDAALAAGWPSDFLAIAKGRAMKRRWLARAPGPAGVYTVSPDIVSAGGAPVDEVAEALRTVASGAVLADIKLAKDLATRQLLVAVKHVSYRLEAGAAWAPSRVRMAAELTKEMLDSGAWATSKFKDYNLESAGRDIGGGRLHALMKVRAEFRQILLEMGFHEMPTNRFVESSFWNFDALFQPQSHPSRDMHDTFFIKAPATSLGVPDDYVARVKAVHEHGGYGSAGYGCAWQLDEALKSVLRTHTTAVSARMLYALANAPGGFKPTRYFSIDRVFRNEALDATHLAEFHQVEGVIADYGLSLGDLLGVIAEFFRRIGIENIRFKPAFNPYTEPSMEIFGYHPDLKKWTEIGNCIPAEDQILTAHGFLNYAEVSEVLAQCGTIDVACYDAANRTIAYEAIDSSRIVAKTGVHTMVQLASAPSCKTENGAPVARAGDDCNNDGDNSAVQSNDVSLMVTGNHELYLRFGRQVSSGSFDWHKSGSGAVMAPAKVQAADLLQCNETDAVQLLAVAAEGLAANGQLPFAAPLKLVTDDSVDAFLELYGYWLGAGSLNLRERTITFQSTNEQDHAYLDSLLARLPLERVEACADVQRGWWAEDRDDGSCQFSIGDPLWWRCFFEEYGCEDQPQDALAGGCSVHGRFIKDEAPALRAMSGRKHVVPTCKCTWCGHRVADLRACRAHHVRSSCKGDAGTLHEGASSAAAGATAEGLTGSNHPRVEGGAVCGAATDAKWLFDWALLCLGKSHARRLIAGLRFAGVIKATQHNMTRRIENSADGEQIWTSSVLFRDQLCQLLTHAGYSVHFTDAAEAGVAHGANASCDNSATATAWAVHYSDQPRAATPSLPLKESLASASYSGTVWCVNVPHDDHLIVSRRVTAVAPDGSVRAASRPVIIGNSGIFRPEMLRPMGLPDGVRVIAWGLSLERPTMIKYRVKNIRDLFGHRGNFDMTRAAPIPRF